MSKHLCFLLLSAIAALTAQPSTNADSSAVQTNRGVRLFEAGQLVEAKNEFQAQLKATPSSAEPHFYLGRIALDQGSYEDAIKHLELASARAPTNPAYLGWLARSYGEQAPRVNYLRGSRLGRKVKATLEKAVALSPDNLELRAGLVEFYSEAPGVVGGSMAQAFKEAEEIRKRDAFRGNLVTGDLYRDNKDFPAAERSYLAAMNADTNRVEPLYRLAWLHVAASQYDKAFDSYEQILQWPGEERIAAFYMIGEVASRSGQRLDRGLQALDNYLRHKPLKGMRSHASAHFLRGKLFEKQGRRDLARTAYEAALKLKPEHKEAGEAVRRLK
jgi:tetratricopeptide (TPR) repeat protein